MKSFANLQRVPSGSMISPDDILEFHASRLLFLISICGVKDRKSGLKKIDGFTKLAKLDFFVRYPSFFEKAAQYLGEHVLIEDRSLESKMVRFHYGPWDHRYYQIIPYLEARGLIKIEKDLKLNSYNFLLTEEGEKVVKLLIVEPVYYQLINKMENVKQVLGKKTGSSLKKLVYKLFDEEIKNKKLGEVIEPW